MRTGVRFWPPHAALTPGIRWGLLRAFAPLEQAPLCPLPNPDEVLSQVRCLGLTMRIFARCPRQVLAAELTPAVLVHETRRVQSTAARGLALEHTLQIVDQTAASLNRRFVLIKGSAIARVAGVPLSLRGACDIDILCERSDAELIHRALKRRGFAEKSPTHPAYHLPMLVNEAGGALEIHTSIPYLRLSPDSHEVTLQQLLHSELTTPAAGMSESAYVPRVQFLLAHCLAHGIAQHGYIPRSYPLLRMLADAVDLGLVDQTAGESFPGRISSAVSRDEHAALGEVALRLTRGDVESMWHDDGPAGRLLRHMVVGSLDERYANGLKLFHAGHILRTFGLAAFVREYGQAAFGLANEDVARIYGNQATDHNIRYKLLRPVDVTARIVRMVPDASRVALRRLRKRTWLNQPKTFCAT